MKEGKHIEYARALLKEIVINKKSTEPQRCPTSHSDCTDEDNVNESTVEGEFEINNDDDTESDIDEEEDKDNADLGLYIIYQISMN